MKNILLKYNLVTILPFEDTFFYTTTLPKNIKLSKELLKINYLKYSPYTYANIIGYTQDKHLFLWFYQKEIQTPIIIPESFLLYNELKKKNQDGVYIIKENTYKVIIIKNGYLVSAFVMQTLDEAVLELSLDEFGLKEKIIIDEQAYQGLYKNAYNSLPIQELYHFNQLDLEPKKVVQSIFDYVAYPLSFIIIFYIAVSYLHTRQLQNEIERLKETYVTQRDKNKEISQGIRRHNKEVKKWKNFIDKELFYPDAVAVLDSIYKIIKPTEKVSIKDISINQGNVTLKFQTDLNPILFLNRLSQNKYVKDVIIQNSYKPRNAAKIITYDIALKPLKEH